MKTINLSWEQAVALLRGLPAQPSAIVGEHLRDEEFIAYATQAMMPEQQARLEAHLDGCEECLERMDLLATAVEEWRTDEGQERLQRLRAELMTQEPGLWQRLRRWLAAELTPVNMTLAPALGQGEDEGWQGGDLAGGLLYWHVETRPDHNLVIHVGSFQLPVGTHVRLYAGEAGEAGKWSSDTLELNLIAADQVGVTLTVDAETRRALRGDARLRVEIIDDEPPTR